MKNNLDLLIKFTISFIISLIIVGYVKNGFIVEICWAADATFGSKLKLYYVYNFIPNLFPSLILSIICICIYSLVRRKNC